MRKDLERAGPRAPLEPPATEATLPPASVRRGTSPEGYRQAVEVAKEYIRAGDAFQVVLSQRFDFDLGCRPVRRLPGAPPGESQPLYVLPAPRGRLGRRGVARADGAVARRVRRLAADRRHAPARPERRSRTARSKRSWSRTRKSAPSTSCSSTWPATTSDGSCASDRARRRAHDAWSATATSCISPREVSGELDEGLGPVDVLRATLPAGTVSGAPKVRAMEIIDELEPTKRGPTPASSDTSTSRATSTPRSPSAPLSPRRTARLRCRPGGHRRRQRPGGRRRGVCRQGGRGAGGGGGARQLAFETEPA